MIERQQFRNRPHRNHLAVRDHRHPVTDFVQRIEIVGNQEHRQVERILQFPGQLIERCRTDRIKARCRLVQKQQLRIERQRPGKSGALAHAARQLGRIFARRFNRQTGQHDLVESDFMAQLIADLGIEFLERDFDVLSHRQRREQRPALEQHPPAAADIDIVIIARVGD